MVFKFPERKYLTFGELLVRWRCSHNDVRHAVITGRLVPSVLLSNVTNELIWVDDDDDEGCSLTEIDPQVPIEQLNVASGWRYLKFPRELGPNDCIFSVVCSQAWPDFHLGRYKGIWHRLPDDLSLSDVEQEGVFMLSEVVRFEQKHKVTAETSQSNEAWNKPEKALGSRERTSYLNIVGALLELVMSPRPGRERQSDVIDELLANYQDKDGISKSNLEKIFAAANRSLRN